MPTQQIRILLGACALSLAVPACSGEDGAEGPRGEEGQPGPEGPKGDDGDEGPRGPEGPRGDDGDRGPEGPEGARGEMGDDGDEGPRGPEGAKGEMGDDGLDNLITQTELPVGDPACFNGGIRFDAGLDTDADGELAAAELLQSSFFCFAAGGNHFNRITSFPICTQLDPNCDDYTETAAEILAASEDGMTLIYSDSPGGVVGFIDISDPWAPLADGTVGLPGEPTSVAVAGSYALVGVNTSADFISVSGVLEVIDIDARSSVASINLGGQPDSVAVSPDGSFAVIVIENERDEDLAAGEGLPQLPGGKVVVVDLSGPATSWAGTDVDMTGLSILEPTDPEPEYVDINAHNVAVVTLQENNGIALIDLATATVTNSFSAGSVDLAQVDATEEDALISQTESLTDVPREPDGVTWLTTQYFATADEGDWLGGSRGFTVFNVSGEVVYGSGNELEHLTARLGHYPDGRSENKGNEPENVEFGVFGAERLLFVNSERSSLVLVYDMADVRHPVFKQALPAGVGPEGALAIPSRNLLVVASEDDNRGDKIRSVVNIYSYGTAPAQYPTLISANRTDGTPIPWAALSGLAADPTDEHTLYSVEDSFFLSNRIFTIDTSRSPARLVDEMRVMDTENVFAAVPTVSLADATVAEDDATRIDVFDEADLTALINSDKSVNIDPEGIAVAADGGFWVVSDGSGTVGDAGRPINSLNFLFKTDAAGVIEDVVTLPDAVNATQLRFGFEGVAAYDGRVYVAFQRAWGSDSGVRIGIYDVAAESWSFVFYSLDAPASQNGGWVGLSDITSLGDGTFLIVERDNQGGPDAAIKKLFTVDLSSVSDGDSVTKTLVRDLMPDLAATGGLTVEKVEGSAVTPAGNVWIVNDNDGVDDNSGETQLLNLGAIL